jgi:hypothetical protein
MLPSVAAGDQPGEVRLEKLNIELANSASEFAASSPRMYIARRAKMVTIWDFYASIRCGPDGNLPPDAEPCERAVWSVLSQLATAPTRAAPRMLG